jgi:hypothetical protein
MTRREFRWLVIVAASFLVGCGSSNIAPGVPANPGAPTNPTPDMGPDPKGQPAKPTP